MKAQDLKVSTSYQQIMQIALPIALALVVPQINFIINNYYLGGLGQLELAAAGITGVTYLIFVVVGSGLNNGLQSIVGRRAGEDGSKEAIGKLMMHSYYIALGFAAISILASNTILPFILKTVLYSEGISSLSIQFLSIRSFGLPFLFLMLMQDALLVATKNSRFLVVGTLSSVIVNVALDYGLIYGHWGMPKLGFVGAAYASVLSEIVGFAAITTLIYYRKMHITFMIRIKEKINKETIQRILTQSTPLIVQGLISILSWGFFYIMIEHYGERDLAVSNVMRNVFGLFGVFSWAFASTSNTMVSNLIGQKRENEALFLIWRISLLSACCTSIFVVLINSMPETILSIYRQDVLFTQAAIPVLRIVSGSLLCMSIATTWLFAVTGTGNTKVNLYIELGGLAFYICAIYYTLGLVKLPITWGWAADGIYWLVLLSASFWYLKSKRWMGKKL